MPKGRNHPCPWEKPTRAKYWKLAWKSQKSKKKSVCPCRILKLNAAVDAGAFNTTDPNAAPACLRPWHIRPHWPHNSHPQKSWFQHVRPLYPASCFEAPPTELHKEKKEWINCWRSVRILNSRRLKVAPNITNT